MLFGKKFEQPPLQPDTEKFETEHPITWQKEGEKQFRRTIDEMVDHQIELRGARLDLQAELNSLLFAPEERQNKARIEELKLKIAELDKEIAELDEFFKWIEE